MNCKHVDCGTKEMLWLPYTYRGMECGLKPHAYCTKCGLIRGATSDRPRRLSYYINIIAQLGREVKVTNVQIRLIAIELEKQGIDDRYGMDRCCQEKLFSEVVRKYVNVSEQIIFRYLNKISL